MSVSESLVLVERVGDVAVIKLNDASKMNAITDTLQSNLLQVLGEVQKDTTCRAIVLTGAGRAFCAGADLKWMERTEDLANRAFRIMEKIGTPLVLALRESPIPIVCAANGPVAGGGVGLALACDVVVAAKSAYFYLPFLTRLGIVPDLGSTWFLERFLGRSRAIGMSLLDERVDAERAVQWGLAWECVDDDKLMERALATAARLAKLPAHAVVEARKAFDSATTSTLADQLSYEARRQHELIGRPTFREGLRAFIEKRNPVFPSR